LQGVDDRQKGPVEDGASAEHEEHAPRGGEGETKRGSPYHFGQCFGTILFLSKERIDPGDLEEGLGMNLADLLVGQGFVGPLGFDDYLQADANDGIVEVNALLDGKRVAEAHNVVGGGQGSAGEAELKRSNPTVGKGELVGLKDWCGGQG